MALIFLSFDASLCIIARMNNPNEKQPKNKGPFRGKKPHKPQGVFRFINNIATTLLVFFVLAAGYSFVADKGTDVPVISVSELASDVSKGLVTSVSVKGDTLNIVYTDGVEKTSKKESDSSLSQTLVKETELLFRSTLLKYPMLPKRPFLTSLAMSTLW
jgi:hypothetical protein